MDCRNWVFEALGRVMAPCHRSRALSEALDELEVVDLLGLVPPNPEAGLAYAVKMRDR